MISHQLTIECPINDPLETVIGNRVKTIKYIEYCRIECERLKSDGIEAEVRTFNSSRGTMCALWRDNNFYQIRGPFDKPKIMKECVSVLENKGDNDNG